MTRRLLVRTVRRLSLEEVNTRLRDLQDKYNTTFENFQERLDRWDNQELFKDYIDWSTMTHAIEAYREGEDFDCSLEEEGPVAAEVLTVLTPKRLELLYEIPKHPMKSINDLADKLARNVKNVYNDLRTLEEHGFLVLKRTGRNVVPELLVEEIAFIFE